MDTKITPNIWTDPKLEDATCYTRLAIFWLLTNPRVNLVGYAEIGLKRFAFETGLNSEALDDAFKALPKGLHREGNAYWIRGYVAHQFGRGPSLVRNNYCKPLLRDLKGVGIPWLVSAVLSEYPELRQSLEEAGLDEGSPLEPKPQRREEQSREAKEKSRVEQLVSAPRPHGLPEVIAYFATKGAPESEAATFFDHYEANGWKQGGRAVIKSWRSAANNWVRRWQDGPMGNEKNSSGSRGARAVPPVPFNPEAPHAHTGGLPDMGDDDDLDPPAAPPARA